MTAMLDLGPAARQMATLLDGITDEQLTAPTPCDEYTLVDLIDAGKIALNELVIHGWDVARASGQLFDCDPQALDASMEFVSLMSTPEGRDGLFGPAVDVPADAPPLIRVLGLSGRDPS